MFCEEEDGEPKSFYSKIDGNVHLKDTVISVHSVLRVEGDVDASSGDIVAGNDVEITGSVRDGAKVSAAGSVTILGGVEEAPRSAQRETSACRRASWATKPR